MTRKIILAAACIGFSFPSAALADQVSDLAALHAQMLAMQKDYAARMAALEKRLAKAEAEAKAAKQSASAASCTARSAAASAKATAVKLRGRAAAARTGAGDNSAGGRTGARTSDRAGGGIRSSPCGPDRRHGRAAGRDCAGRAALLAQQLQIPASPRC